MSVWPGGPTRWIENRTLYVSIPFTWNLPDLANDFKMRDMEYDRIVAGGPATFLMPRFFDGMEHVTVGKSLSGVLQRVNPLATRTTEGCPNGCAFCGVIRIEPIWRELADWPDNPMLCDNNLLACEQPHFDKVMDRLERHGWCDFNQGLDCRILSSYHAERIGRVRKAIVRMALDSVSVLEEWYAAADLLHHFKTAKSRIRSYVLCGFNDDPGEAWSRCKAVKKWGGLPLPQWFHELDAMKSNAISEKQKGMGWTNAKRIELFRHYYS